MLIAGTSEKCHPGGLRSMGKPRFPDAHASQVSHTSVQVFSRGGRYSPTDSREIASERHYHSPLTISEYLFFLNARPTNSPAISDLKSGSTGSRTCI